MSTWDDAADFVAEQSRDYYGTDLFPLLPPEFDWALLDRWLSDTFGFRIDRLSAEYYRRTHALIERRLRERGDDA
jgi:hypothetical protein